MYDVTLFNERLRSHVESHYPILSLVTFEEKKADRLIDSLAEGRKIWEWNMARGWVHFKNKVPILPEIDLETTLTNWLDDDLDGHFLVIKDAHLALHNNPVVVARLKVLANAIVHDDDTRATIFLVSPQACVPPELEKFITLFELPLPDEAAIAQLIKDFVKNCVAKITDDAVDKLTQAFRGLSEHEIHHLLGRAYQQKGYVDAEDVALVLEEKKQVIQKSGALEMVPVTEGFDGIGGLDKLKDWLRKKEKVLADLTAARAFGVDAPKGVMIVGMPGCGKSLTAKAAAALFQLPLMRLDIGSMMGKYVGESEANMRRALRLAEAVSPCVLWVDELEKAFVGINSGTSNSEVASRLFGYFLTWMQEKTGAVFVLATANDISALPPELMRKGRFDEIFHVGFPTEAEREAILHVHLKKRKKDSAQIDVKRLSAKTEGFSGADLEGVVKDAVEQAFLSNKAALTTDHLLRAAENTYPLGEVMKDKIAERLDEFSKMRLKPAS